MGEVAIEHPGAGVAMIRLCAAARKNALTGDMARELNTALAKVDDDTTIGVVIITGGQETFCAGAHRRLLAAVATGDAQAQADIAAVYAIFDHLRNLRAPSIAAICGPAVGAGLNLALACSVRLVGAGALLRSMFVANEIHPAGGHLRMLHDVGGRSLVARMAVLDEPLSAEAAVLAGLAQGPYPPAEVEPQAVALAERAAATPALARWIHRSAHEVTHLTDEQAADAEAAAQARSLRDRSNQT